MEVRRQNEFNAMYNEEKLIQGQTFGVLSIRRGRKLKQSKIIYLFPYLCPVKIFLVTEKVWELETWDEEIFLKLQACTSFAEKN